MDNISSVPTYFVLSFFLAKEMSKIGDTGCKSTRYPMSGQSHVSVNGAMPIILFYFSRTHHCSRTSSTPLTTKDIFKKISIALPFFFFFLGVQGIQGIRGIQGPQGVQGKDGRDGRDGRNGAKVGKKILIIKMKKGKKREKERPNIWFE